MRLITKNVKRTKKAHVLQCFLTRWRHSSSDVQNSIDSNFYHNSNELSNVQIDQFFKKLCEFEVFATTSMKILPTCLWAIFSLKMSQKLQNRITFERIGRFGRLIARWNCAKNCCPLSFEHLTMSGATW